LGIETELIFEISGKEGGTPIVLVPGGLSGWISWKPHAEILLKDFKVIRVHRNNKMIATANETLMATKTFP
jgi:hypothetical protein